MNLDIYSLKHRFEISDKEVASLNHLWQIAQEPNESNEKFESRFWDAYNDSSEVVQKAYNQLIVEEARAEYNENMTEDEWNELFEPDPDEWYDDCHEAEQILAS